MPDEKVRTFEDFVIGKLNEIREEYVNLLGAIPENEFRGGKKENTLLSVAVYVDHVSMFVITDSEHIISDKYGYFGRKPWEEE